MILRGLDQRLVERLGQIIDFPAAAIRVALQGLAHQVVRAR